MTRIHSIRIGQPTQLADAQGDWRFSIFRKGVAGPVELAPGNVEAGDARRLQARLDQAFSVPAVNRCGYATFDAAIATQLAAMPELMQTWRA